MAKTPPPEQDPASLLFAGYITGKRIVIADSSVVARSAIAQCLTTLGARTTDLALVPNFEEAEHQIARHRPHVVITDFDLGKHCGLNLLKLQREYRPESQETLFVMVTGNTSQTTVAMAAEEDVDTFVLKPFTPQTLKASILKAAMLKMQPPPYLAEIERGKQALAAALPEMALEIFMKAKALDLSPSLACFYVAQARVMKKDFDGAISAYNEGLIYNQVHYKCLAGLYDLFMAQNEYQKAYEVIRKIARIFPANPQRLTAVLRLAIVTQNYEDITHFYETFTNVDVRSEESVRYICAALVVCGKYFIQQNDPQRALELFQKAAATGSSRTRIMREIVLDLVNAGLVDEAASFVPKFPADTQSSSDYAAANLVIVDRKEGASAAIHLGRHYLKQGLHDPQIYKILIERSFEVGFDDSAEDLVRSAALKWPEQKSEFEGLLPG